MDIGKDGFEMAREKLGGLVVLLRLGSGVGERIDGVAGAGRRSEWIRGVIDAALDGAVVPVVMATVPERVSSAVAKKIVPPVVPAVVGSGAVKKVQRRFPMERGMVMDELRKRPRMQRVLRAELGIGEMLLNRVVQDLVTDGEVVFHEGLLSAVRASDG